MTLIEIQDVIDLLNALFKINIDIAHKEYFLKVAIPEKTDWWYGYTLGEDSAEQLPVVCSGSAPNVIWRYNESTEVICPGMSMKWISFEPTVEFKFSNLHAANQVVNGRLVCTVKDRDDTPHIVPVNRELLDDEGFQYNDSMYCYDYAKSLEAMWSISGT